jgi:hypothetical protein
MQRKDYAMKSTIGRPLLRVLSYALPEVWAERLVHRWAHELRAEIEGELTDKFLEALLFGMELGFLLIRTYRRNIKHFSASYVFGTGDGRVAATAQFAEGHMRVHEEAIQPANATVTFATPAALRHFLFSQNQDIIESMLANEVEVDGNLNYIYRFGFLARDLTLRLGIAQ